MKILYASSKVKQKRIMKKRCKNINITDAKTVRPWVEECIMRHKRRRDFKRLLIRYGLSDDLYRAALESQKYTSWDTTIQAIAREAANRIKNKDLALPLVKMREREDRTTGKIRLIGKESPFQQIFDYIAVRAAKEIFDARLVMQQCSSVPGRGQVYGMRMIRKHVKNDNRCIRWAEKHKKKYTSKCKYFVKLDIRKCYPNSDANIFLQLFARDCGNADLLWLWKTLLYSHRIDGYTGFMIGSLVSQWAAQYMISYIYRYAMGLAGVRRGKRTKWVSHMVCFMDDMLLFSSNRKNLLRAVRRIISYAKTKLHYTIKQSFAIQRLIDVGSDMMGYIVYRSGKVAMRGRNFIKSRRLALRYAAHGRLTVSQARRIVSYKGFYKHSDCTRAMRKYHMRRVFLHAQRIAPLFKGCDTSGKNLLRDAAEQNFIYALI